MRILVTGAGGFVGRYLLRELLEHGHEVFAIGTRHRDIFDEMNIPFYKANVLEIESLMSAMRMVQPDGIMHLAAQSNVHESWDCSCLTVDTNVNGTINVVKAASHVCPQAKLLCVGSSDEYGITAKLGLPLNEGMQCLPQNPYAASKLCAEQMALLLAKRYAMKLVYTRSFNHFGPGQKTGFVISDFSSQIASIEDGSLEPILRVGDLSSYRDFTFVEDVVHAYVLLMENPDSEGVYNVCSGKAVRIEKLLQVLVGLSKVKIDIVKDAAKLRPVDVPFFVGSSERLRLATGWSIRADLRSNLENTLNWWRENV